MNNLSKLGGLVLVAIAMFFYSKCGSNGNWTGREYMPDMAHPIAYEANVEGHSYYNTWAAGSTGFSVDDRSMYTQPRLSPDGALARGHEVYHYGNTEDERKRATAEITTNPIPFTKAGYDKGKVLYDIYCGVCHGKKADGNGVLYKEGAGPYPVMPQNLMKDTFKNANDGLFYHAIMHGKNVMGSYKTKLDVEERWLVIHYIRSLQFGGDVKTDADKRLDSTLVAPKPAAGVERIVSLYNVFFNTGLHTLRSNSMTELDAVASVLNKYPNINIQVNGHTDNAGDPATNMVLSNDRALEVMNYLIDSGVSAKRLSYKGYGSTKPISTDMAKNRRVDLTILN
jgi:outer membrane protein OmpA-like peptidoglycan-associated protein